MDIEITNGTTEKFIPHPILDDPDKMMRIIANPVYDKLTISRAGHIRKRPPAGYVRKSVRIIGPTEETMITSLKPLNSEETKITSLNSPGQPKAPSKRQNLPSISPVTRSSNQRVSPRNLKLLSQSRTGSVRSSFTDSDKKSPIIDGTVRYVHSRHGFEVQRYSSSNWLSIDLLTKDACESEEKTFREMIGRKEQTELSSRSIFTSEYYRQRFEDLLQSYKDGHLTHDQWARQNYQLNCLKIFYMQALEREQGRTVLHEQDLRQKRAQCVFNEWKEAKDEGQNDRRRSRLGTANSHFTTDVTSVLSNPSSFIPNQKNNHVPILSTIDNESDELPILRPLNRSKQSAKIRKTSYMFCEDRWSLNAMLKRVVGLAEPLPPAPPKIVSRRQSALTSLGNDSGF